MAVLEAPLGHLLHRPVGGVLEVRRAGQARAIHVGEVVHGAHDLRVVFRFRADPGVDFRIDFFGREDRPGGHRQCRERRDEGVSHARNSNRRDGLLACWRGVCLHAGGARGTGGTRSASGAGDEPAAGSGCAARSVQV